MVMPWIASMMVDSVYGQTNTKQVRTANIVLDLIPDSLGPMLYLSCNTLDSTENVTCNMESATLSESINDTSLTP